MNYLPYGGGSFGGWFGAFSVSAAVHGAIFAGFLGAYGSFGLDIEPEEEAANFVVTLERLDNDTLAGIVEREGEAGSDGVDPDAPPPEEAPPEPELEAPPETPAEDLPPEPPVVPDELVAEPAEAIAPEVAAPVVAEDAALSPITPDPVETETVVALPVSPDDADLSPILPETIAPVTAAPSPTSSQALAPVPQGPLSVTPVQPAASPVVVAANRSPVTSARTPVVATPPSQQDLALGDLIRRIKDAPADPCLVALPRRDGDAGVGIAIVAARDGEMETFAQAFLGAQDAAIRQTRTLVDPRQCPALTYVRQNIDYPATRMGLRIDELEILSGDRLTGVVRGASGRHLTLMLVDDNGVVQDLQRFLSFSGNLARFDVPVTRDGQSRDTSQILIALGTTRAPADLTARNGQLAQDVFGGLTGELANGAHLAFATFDVR